VTHIGGCEWGISLALGFLSIPLGPLIRLFPIGPSRDSLRCVYYALFLSVFSHNSLAHFFRYCDNDANYKLDDRSTPPYSYRIIYELRFSRTYLIPPDLVTSMAHKPFRLQVHIQTDPSEVFDIPDSNLEPPGRQRLKEGQDGNA